MEKDYGDERVVAGKVAVGKTSKSTQGVASSKSSAALSLTS